MVVFRSPQGWGKLPSELIGTISRVLLGDGDGASFVRMAMVCKNWRRDAISVVSGSNEENQWPKLPLLMLGESKKGQGQREFYSLLTHSVVFSLPIPQLRSKRLISLHYGWLLVICDKTGECFLFHLFSGSIINLPRFISGPGFSATNPSYTLIRRAALSANPSSSKNFVLGVCSQKHFCIWRSNEDDWVCILGRGTVFKCFRDVIFSYTGSLFYILASDGIIWTYHLHTTTLRDYVLNNPTPIGLRSAEVLCYLFESGNDLLICSRNGSFPNVDNVTNKHRYGSTQFRVFVVYLETCYVQRIYNLNEAIFVGNNSAITVQNVPKSIFFTDDSIDSYLEDLAYMLPPIEPDGWGIDTDLGFGENGDGIEPDGENGDVIEPDDKQWIWSTGTFDPSDGGGRNMGMFSLEDDTVVRIPNVPESLSAICPPTWILFPPN